MGSLRLGLCCYLLSSLPAILGVVFGNCFLPAQVPGKRSDLVAAFASWDGEWYERIASKGYQYRPGHPSSVAFFPTFPLLGRAVAHVTGLPTNAALLLVSHGCLAFTFVALAGYLRRRLPAFSSEQIGYVLIAFGLWPTTCFFRFAYSESTFLLCAVLCFYAMAARWPLPVISLLVGLTTATRPVGVALLVPFVWHIWNTPQGRLLRLVALLTLVPAACWGIAAYIAYQWQAFGDPLAFAHTQTHWSMRFHATLGDKIVNLLRLEPVLGIFDPNSACYWGRFTPPPNPLLSLDLANSIYFLLGVGLLVLGFFKRWISPAETVFGLCLVAIPYATRSHEMCMAGMGRFTAAAFPMYIVLGHLLGKLSTPLVAGCLSISGFFLAAYSALFASWHRIF